MYTIPSLKLNKKQNVDIPSPKELFKRFGMTTKSGQFSGDDTPPENLSKVEQAAEVAKIAFED